MTENQKIGTFIALLIILVSTSAFFVAERSGLWRELWITVLFSLFMGVATWGLVRRPNDPK
jgi:hypothetical protein